MGQIPAPQLPKQGQAGRFAAMSTRSKHMRRSPPPHVAQEYEGKRGMLGMILRNQLLAWNTYATNLLWSSYFLFAMICVSNIHN